MPGDAQNPVNNEISLAKSNNSSRLSLIVAVAVGIFTALLSVSLEYPSLLLSGGAGLIVTTIAFPGILGSMAIGGNAHAFSLWVAAGLNFVLYFIFIWSVCKICGLILRELR